MFPLPALVRTSPDRSWVAGATAALLLASEAIAAPAVRLVSPRRGEVVSGKAVIKVEVTELEGARVEIFVDGKPAGAVSAPPWEVGFDFGETLAARRIRAVATATDGTRLETELITRALDIEHVDAVARVDLVNLYVTVRDRGGRIVEGLQESDFRVLENGRQQTLSHYSSERQPLAVGLVLDSSLSMRQEERITAAKDAATRFLDSLRPTDRALVVCFNEGVKLEQEVTSERPLLAAAISRCTPRGGTALYDAIYRGAETLGPLEGRKVILLLSDGRDEAESGLEPGSLHTLDEAVDRALRGETIVFAVGVGKNLDREMDFTGRISLAGILDRLATTSGGRALLLKRPSEVKDAFEEIQEELRLQYALAYSPTDLKRDGGWRELKVIVNRPGLTAYTRTGYFAPKAR